MSRKKQPEEPTEGSPVAGGCVLLVLAAGLVAVVFAVSPTAGVLTVWGVGAAALWRCVHRAANPAPPPSSEGAANTNPQFTVTEDQPGHCTIHWQKEVNER